MKRTALVLGYPYHTRTLANFVNANSSRWRIIAGGTNLAWRYRGILALPFVDAVLAYGGPAPDALLAACARRMRKPIAVIWAGTDVVNVRNTESAVARTRARRYHHVACSHETAAELQSLGIEARVLRLAVATPPEAIAPFGDFRVLSYLPGHNETLYGAETIRSAARRFPDVPFDVIGNRHIRERRRVANVTYHGWIGDTNPLVDASTVLLRPTQRDGGGPPLMVLEALARGRYVIWSRECPGAFRGRSLDEIVSQLGWLRAQHRVHRLQPNHAGVESIRQSFLPESVTHEIEEFLDELAADVTSSAERAVVSGSPDAVAAFLEDAAYCAPQLELHALLGRSRAERLDDVLSMLTTDRWLSVDGGDVDPLVKVAAQVLHKKPEYATLSNGRTE